MRAPPARALLLIPRRGPALRAWAPAVSSRTWLASEWTPLVRPWTSLIHESSSGLRFPAPLSGLSGGVGRWATSSGARRCWVLAGLRAAHPLFSRFQGAAATGVRDLGNDSRRRPAATRHSEVWKLLGLMRPERGRLSAAVGFLTVSSVITMSAPFFLGRIIDVIYTNPGEDYSDSLTQLCAALTCVFLCGAAANGIRVYLMQSSGQSIVNRLRTSLFSSILRQEVAFFDKTRTGELINRLSSDTALLGRSVTENLSDGLRAVAQASVGIGMMVCQPLLLVFSVRARRTRAGEHERLEVFLSICKHIEPRTLPADCRGKGITSPGLAYISLE